VLFGDGVRLVAYFEHRVVPVDRDAHDLLSPRFALGAAAHPVEKFVETVLANASAMPLRSVSFSDVMSGMAAVRPPSISACS
jgi:hypothetical protein